MYHTIHIRIPPLFIHHLLQKFIVLIDLRYVPYWNFPDLRTYYISFRPVWVSYDMNYSFFDMKDMGFARLLQRFTSFTTSRAALLPLLFTSSTPLFSCYNEACHQVPPGDM